MLFRFILVAIAIASVFSWSVNLEKQEIPVQNLPADESIYTSKVNFGTEENPVKINTVFDFTSSLSWVLEANICPTCFNGQPGPVNCEKLKNTCSYKANYGGYQFGFGGQLQFTSPKDGASKNTFRYGTDNINVAGNQFENVEVGFPVDILPPSKDALKADFFVKSQASIGLGHSSENSFLNALNNPDNGNVKADATEFSMYLGSVNKLIIGKPEEFFKVGEWATYKNYNDQNSVQLKESYSLKATNVLVGTANVGLTIKDKDAQANKNSNNVMNSYAVFSSTTQYIYFESVDTLNTIVKQINEVSGGITNCKEQGAQEYYFICENIDHFPSLTFTLAKGDKSENFTLEGSDYTKVIQTNGEKKKMLLLRRGIYGYQNYQLSALQGAGSESLIWFGQPFLRKYYVNFNYKSNQISIAKAYQFEPQEKQVKYITRIVYLIFGIGGLVLLITVILCTLKDVPYVQPTRAAFPDANVPSQRSPSKLSISKSVKKDSQTLSNFVHIPRSQIPAYNQSPIASSSPYKTVQYLPTVSKVQHVQTVQQVQYN